MAHDHSSEPHETTHAEPKSKTGLSSAFWLILIVGGLFVASLNFMKVMGVDEGGGHGGHEAGVPAHKEASSNGTMHGESGTGKPAANVQHDATTHGAAEAGHTEGEAAH